MELAGSFFADAANSLLFVFVVFLRIGTASAIVPVFGERNIPPRVRLSIALCMSILIASASPATIKIERDFGRIAQIMLSEPAIGLMLGVGIRLLLHALQTAGTIAAQATSLAQLFGGASSEPMPAVGNLFVIAGLALVVVLDLHLLMIATLMDSYQILPIGALIDPTALIDWGTSQVMSAFTLAFSLSAPFILVSLIYNLGLGVINKAMPQLMVALVGAPAITGGTLILLFLSTPFLLETWTTALESYLRQPLGQPDG